MFFKKKNQLISSKDEIIQAIKDDNVEKFSNTEYLMKFSNETLELLYSHNAINIIKDNQEDYNLLANDTYGFPLWWKAFKTKNNNNLPQIISFLKELDVDLNTLPDTTFNHSYTLAWDLLSSYKYKSLYHLLASANIDVNIIHRTDLGGTLLQALSYLEGHRRHAFLNPRYEGGTPNEYIDDCIDIIQDKATSLKRIKMVKPILI